MPEPTLEFLGQRLKAVQDEQHAIRGDLRTITNRLDRLIDRIDRDVELSQARFDRLEALIGGEKS